MAATPLWHVSIVAPIGYESGLTACLEQVCEETVSSYVDLERGEVRASVYLAKRPGRDLERRLDHSLARLPEFKRGTAPVVAIQILRPREWVNAWKRHFRAMTIGGRLLIKPSWSRKRPSSGQRTVILDPGLSFGTGQHPTTRFCLERLAALRPVEGVAKSMLDVGTGSGILAIAARKLGFNPVDALDHDPVAVRVALANARRNRVRIRVWNGDATERQPTRRSGYDVVCANLTSDLLLGLAGNLTAQVRPKGCLLLAGILGSEFERVQSAYAKVGWRLTRTKAVGEWQSGSFVAI
jgi:ribosomal protein L11 methyltransferase